MSIYELKESLRAIEAEKRALDNKRRVMLSDFIKEKEGEGWVHLQVDDYAEYGECYCCGSNILLTPEGVGALCFYIKKEHKTTLDIQWLKENEDKPERIASFLQGFIEEAEDNSAWFINLNYL